MLYPIILDQKDQPYLYFQTTVCDPISDQNSSQIIPFVASFSDGIKLQSTRVQFGNQVIRRTVYPWPEHTLVHSSCSGVPPPTHPPIHPLGHKSPPILPPPPQDTCERGDLLSYKYSTCGEMKKTSVRRIFSGSIIPEKAKGLLVISCIVYNVIFA